jgi:hypothetical protein
MNTRGVRLLWFTVVLFVLTALPAFAADARVVRLSLAQGDVQIDRNAGDGWEQAINNMPVIAGARIYAAENSRAELEFEDGSSVRLAGPAQITLLELSSTADGSLLSSVQVDSGLVYANVKPRKNDTFRILTSGAEPFTVTQPTHLRLNVDQQTASLSVMQGEAVLQSANSRVHSGETYNYVLAQPESAARQESVPTQPDDSWDQQRNTYNDQYAALGAQFSGNDDANAPGAADLGAYGSYSNVPGYGVAWQPNGVDADWSPYDNGAWSYYPNWGWTFVSGYPWGWTPFFFGDWCFQHGRGWFWRPGPHHGFRDGFRNGGFHPGPRFTGAPLRGFNAPHPPAGSTRGTVAVAGSHLPVGPISATHSPTAGFGFASQNRSGSSVIGTAAGTMTAHVGPTSSPVRGPASNLRGPSIVGQRGSYSLSNGPGMARNGVHRPGAPVHLQGVPEAGASRTYRYSGAPAPRTFTGPPVSMPRGPSAMPRGPSAPVGSAPHVSGGSSFHGGGAASSGAVHSSGGSVSSGGSHSAGGHR